MAAEDKGAPGGPTSEELRQRHCDEKKILAECGLGGIVKLEGVKDGAPTDKIVRGGFLAWLLADPDAVKTIHPKGLHLKDARFPDLVDLRGLKIDFPLTFENCLLEGGLVLRDSITRTLNLSSATIGKIDWSYFEACGFADDIEAAMDGKSADGAIAVYADGIHVRGELHTDNDFVSYGAVWLRGAEIDGLFHLQGGKLGFSSRPGSARIQNDSLRAENSTIKGSLHIGKTIFFGSVVLRSARIEGRLLAEGARVFRTPAAGSKKDPRPAINLRNARIGGDLEFNSGFESRGTLLLNNARIGGFLDFEKSTIRGRGIGGDTAATAAIEAQLVETGGTVYIKKSNFFGSCCFAGATVHGQVFVIESVLKATSTSGGKKVETDSDWLANSVLLAEAIIVRGDVKFEKATLEGYIGLQSARVSGRVSIDKGTSIKGLPLWIKNRERDDPKGCVALSLQYAETGEGVYLTDECRAKGLCDFHSAKIGGRLVLLGQIEADTDKPVSADFARISEDPVPPDDCAVNASRIRVETDVVLRHSWFQGHVDLSNAEIGGSITVEKAAKNSSDPAVRENCRPSDGPYYELNLCFSRATRLDFSPSGWVGAGFRPAVKGLEYRSLKLPDDMASVRKWLDLLCLQDGDRLRSLQPYEQLQKTLLEMGVEGEIFTVVKAKQKFLSNLRMNGKKKSAESKIRDPRVSGSFQRYHWALLLHKSPYLGFCAIQNMYLYFIGLLTGY